MKKPPASNPEPQSYVWLRGLAVLALLFIFLMGVRGLGDGFKALGKDYLDLFFAATSNPVMGLIVGILGTTLVQSSSVTTSIIVGLVAAPENPLPLANAVPMVMGANIGTTVTNTVVSLAHMGRKEEFRRAFAVATCHDFFNYMAVLILLPMEIMTGFLRRSAGFVAELLSGVGGYKYQSPLKGALKTALAPVQDLSHFLSSSEHVQAVIMIAFSAVFIFVSLLLLVRVMRSLMQSRVESVVNNVLGSNAILAIVVGAVVTVMVQSSSITTSLLVPLAGAGLLALEAAFPITLGANLGTTVTGLLASLAVSGVNAGLGLQVALVHLFFNLSGTVLIYPVPMIRRIPLRMARWLADAAVRSRKMALLYVAFLFYVLPVLLLLLERALKNR